MHTKYWERLVTLYHGDPIENTELVTLRPQDQIGKVTLRRYLTLRKVGASQCYLCKVCLKFELQTVSTLSLTPEERAAQCYLSRSDHRGAVLPGVPLFLNFELTRA